MSGISDEPDSPSEDHSVQDKPLKDSKNKRKKPKLTLKIGKSLRSIPKQLNLISPRSRGSTIDENSSERIPVERESSSEFRYGSSEDLSSDESSHIPSSPTITFTSYPSNRDISSSSGGSGKSEHKEASENSESKNNMKIHRTATHSETSNSAVNRAKLLERFASTNQIVNMKELNVIENNIQSPFTSRRQAADADESAPILPKTPTADRKLQKRFNLPNERVIDTFLCALLLRNKLLAQGTLFVTENNVCFYAKVFGKITRICVAFSEILLIRKCKLFKSIPNAIEVHTPEKKYFWASFLHRTEAFHLLDSRWRLIQKKSGRVPDVWLNHDDNNVRDIIHTHDDDDGEEDWDSPHSPSSFSYPTSPMFRSGSDSSGYDDLVLNNNNNNNNSNNNHDVNNNSGNNSSSGSGINSSNSVGSHIHHQSDSPPVLYKRPPLSAKCCHENRKSVHVAPRYSEIFALTVEQFYYNFLSEHGVPFWREFHSKDGYDHFTLSPWNLSAEECCFERHAEFRAPISSMSIAPIYTRVIQQQRCRFLSENEIIFETSSHSRDVPFSNQFLVESRWHISRFDDHQCELNISVHVRFIKKNWFGPLIERNAIEGSRDWFENWIKSALAVTEHIRRNETIPENRRVNQQQILRESITNLASFRSENQIDPLSTGIDEPVPANPLIHFFYLILAERSLKYAMFWFLLIMVSLSCSLMIFYLRTGMVASEVSLLREQTEQLQSQTNQLWAQLNDMPRDSPSMEKLAKFWHLWKYHRDLERNLQLWNVDFSEMDEYFATLREYLRVGEERRTSAAGDDFPSSYLETRTEARLISVN